MGDETIVHFRAIKRKENEKSFSKMHTRCINVCALIFVLKTNKIFIYTTKKYTKNFGAQK